MGQRVCFAVSWTTRAVLEMYNSGGCIGGDEMASSHCAVLLKGAIVSPGKF